MQALKATLHLLMEALTNVPIVEPPVADNDNYLPVLSDLDTLFTHDAATMQQVIEPYLAEVKERWNRAGFVLTDMLSEMEQAASAMAGASVQPLRGLPNNDVSYYPFLLSLNQSSRPTDLAVQLVTQASLAQAVATAAQNKQTALDAVMQLRNLDDILIRLLSAYTVAGNLGVSLAEGLAMYRTEGNLSVPRATGTLDALIPAHQRPQPEPTSTKGLNIGWLTLLADPARSQSDADAKDHALGVWMVQIAGLDWVGQIRGLPRVDGSAAGATSRKTLFGEWSSRNWQANEPLPPPPGTYPGDREAVWQSLLDNLDVAKVGRDANGQLHRFALADAVPPQFETVAVRVTPRDPELLVVSVLEESVKFHRYLARADTLLGPLPDSHPLKHQSFPLATAYAFYNLQIGSHYANLFPSWKGGQPRQNAPPEAFLISALAAASGSRGTPYRDLRTEIGRETAFLQTTQQLRKAIAKLTPDEAKAQYWNVVQEWLAHPVHGANRIALLSEFVETADTRYWRGWEAPRGNLSRYRRLRHFYHEI